MAGMTEEQRVTALLDGLAPEYPVAARGLRLAYTLYGLPAVAEEASGSRWVLRLAATEGEGPAGALLVEHIDMAGKHWRVAGEHKPRKTGRPNRSVRLDDGQWEELERSGEPSTLIREAVELFLAARRPG